MARYVRFNARICEHSLCKLCGTAGGCSPSGCGRVTCLACGSPQCSSNGLGRGQCSICYVGILPGWSSWQQTCGYKGCGVQAVARIGGLPSAVCAHHLERRKPGYIAARIAERDKGWILVPDMMGEILPASGPLSKEMVA